MLLISSHKKHQLQSHDHDERLVFFLSQIKRFYSKKISNKQPWN